MPSQKEEARGHAMKPERKPAERGVTFCPRCGSTNVFWASGLPQLWSIWECRRCGYRGAFILKDGKLAEKLRSDYKKKISNVKK